MYNIPKDKTKNVHFIKAPCHQSTRQPGYQYAPTVFKEKYDFEIDEKQFSGSAVKIAPGYDCLYNHILQFSKQNPDIKIVTVGGDNSISASTVAAINEKYIKTSGEKTYSNLFVLWIDTNADTESYETSKDLCDMPVSSLMGIIEPTFAKHKLLLDPTQLIYFGINDNDAVNELIDIGCKVFTAKKIKSIGIDKIANLIKNIVVDNPVHIVFDLKILDKSNDFDSRYLMDLVKSVKNNVVAVDIVEFNPYISKNEESVAVKKTVHELLANTFDIKEKNINIFSEDSQFIIYRPVNQVDQYDYGWYIMRGLTLDKRNDIIKDLDHDTTTHITVDDTDYLVALTTMGEQNDKFYYACKSIEDFVLFPDEKQDALFELLNTSQL